MQLDIELKMVCCPRSSSSNTYDPRKYADSEEALFSIDAEETYILTVPTGQPIRQMPLTPTSEFGFTDLALTFSPTMCFTRVLSSALGFGAQKSHAKPKLCTGVKYFHIQNEGRRAHVYSEIAAQDCTSFQRCFVGEL